MSSLINFLFYDYYKQIIYVFSELSEELMLIKFINSYEIFTKMLFNKIEMSENGDIEVLFKFDTEDNINFTIPDDLFIYITNNEYEKILPYIYNLFTLHYGNIDAIKQRKLLQEMNVQNKLLYLGDMVQHEQNIIKMISYNCYQTIKENNDYKSITYTLKNNNHLFNIDYVINNTNNFQDLNDDTLDIYGNVYIMIYDDDDDKNNNYKLVVKKIKWL